MKHLKNKDMPDWAVGEEVSTLLREPIDDCKSKGYAYLSDWFRTNIDVEVSQSFLVTRAKYYGLHDFYTSSEEVKELKKAEQLKKQVNEMVEERINTFEIWLQDQIINRADARLAAYHWRLVHFEENEGLDSPDLEDVLIDPANAKHLRRKR